MRRRWSRAARAAGVPVWGEVELAHRMLPNPFVGVTGTNGKTTTTELIGAMLRAGGRPVEVAGNVGRALTELPGRIDPDAWVVAELSSFQLEDIDTFHAEVAVVLNITPDHLDRHGSLDAYLRAKLRLLENQRREDVAVLNADDPILRAGDLPGRGRRSGSRAISPTGSTGSMRASVASTTSRTLSRPRWPPRRSASPWPTATAPCATSSRRRTGWSWWRPATASSFVNDSKATNPEAAMMALTAFDDGIRLILGGSLKGASFAELAEAVADGPVAGVYLIGQAAGAIATELDERGVAHTDSGDLPAAVAQAAADASPGDTVLLSPHARRSTSSATTSTAATSSAGSPRRCPLASETASEAAPRRRGGRPPRREAVAPIEYHLLMLVTLGLVAFGLIMVYSASSGTAVLFGRDPVSVLMKQGIYAGLGIALMAGLARFPYRRLRYMAVPVLGLDRALLVLVLVPGIGARSTTRGAGCCSARSRSSRPSSPRRRCCSSPPPCWPPAGGRRRR